MTAVLTRKRLLLVVVGLFVLCRGAAAQSTTYVTGTAFADIKRFSSSRTIGSYPYGSDFSRDATSPGGGFRIGTYLHPKWSIELAVDSEAAAAVKTPNVPYRIATTYQNATAIYPPFPVPQPTDTTTSTRFLTVSTAIGFHPSPRGRVRPAYFAGFSLVRATYKSTYLNYIVPLASTIAVPPTGMPVPIYYPPPTRTTVKQTTNTSGAMLGFEAAIGFGQHVAVVPEIRALTLSFQGDGVFLIRPGVGVRWSF